MQPAAPFMLDPLTCGTVRLREALQAGGPTRDRVEHAAVLLLTRTGIGDLVDREAVRRAVFQHPVTRAWLIDWHKLAEHRFDMILSPGERVVVELACALTADTPIRFLGSGLARLDAGTQAEVLIALRVALDPG